MITKIVVDKDKIELYQDKEVVLTVDNTEKNTELPRLFNNMVFATKDVMTATQKHDYTVRLLRRSAIFSFCFAVLTAINLAGLGTLAMFGVFYNLLKFMACRRVEKETFNKLNSYKNKRQEIHDQIKEIKDNPGDEKSDTYSLEFSDDQILIDHSMWVKEFGDEYDYQGDLETIRNDKVLIL